MSWFASTGPVHRYELWQAIDALTATQDGLDFIGQEQLAQQLHGAKAAAKVLCNTFPSGEYPELIVHISGHVNTGPGSAGNWLQASVTPPAPPVIEPEPPQPEPPNPEPPVDPPVDPQPPKPEPPAEPAQE